MLSATVDSVYVNHFVFSLPEYDIELECCIGSAV